METSEIDKVAILLKLGRLSFGVRSRTYIYTPYNGDLFLGLGRVFEWTNESLAGLVNQAFEALKNK